MLEEEVDLPENVLEECSGAMFTTCSGAFSFSSTLLSTPDYQ